MQYRVLLVVAALAFSANASAGPIKIYWSAQDCSTSNLQVNPVADGNPSACQGFIDRDPGGANDSEEVLNSTPIHDGPLQTDPILFTGFFGFTDWDFAQKEDNGTGLTTDIDLGLSVNSGESGWDWDITDGALGVYEHAIAIVKQTEGFDAYLLSNNLGAITGGSFDSDWSHFSIYVRGGAKQVPEPGTLALLGGGLLGLVTLRRRRAA